MKEKKQKTERSLFRKIQNGILSFLFFILIVFLLLFAFTQTKTFRTYLNEKTTEIVNESISGEIKIGEIDGSLFTSLILRDTKVFREKDTLLFAKKIEVSISPLEILMNKIYIRNLIIDNANFSLSETNDGINYFDYILAPPVKDTLVNINDIDTDTEIADTSKSPFPFIFVVNNFELWNSSFSITKAGFKNNNSSYKTINPDNFKVNDITLKASAVANINKSDFFFNLKRITATPNLKSFNLLHLSGKFRANKKFAYAEELIMQSDSSNIYLNAKMDNLNLFAPIDIAEFKTKPVIIDFYAQRFNFDDLTTFVPATDMLKGNTSLRLNARGEFGDLQIDQLSLDYNKTHLDFSGKILKLDTPAKLRVNGKFVESSVYYNDVMLLLPGLDLPKFKDLMLKDFNLDYAGEPLDFRAKIAGKTSDGRIAMDVKMNLNHEPASYKIKLETKKLNLKNLMGINSSLNSVITAEGSGFAPTQLNTFFDVSVKSSKFDVFDIDSLEFNTTAISKVLNLNLKSGFNNSAINLYGDLDLTNEDRPVYNLEGRLENLNIAEFVVDSTLNSSLNFSFLANGRHLDIDSLTGKFVVKLDESQYRDVNIESSSLELTATKNNSFREINLISDFIDFNIFGEFSLQDATDLLVYQGSVIPQIINKQTQKLNPNYVFNDSTEVEIIIPENEDVVNKTLDFSYSYQLKDFELLATLFEVEQFSFQGLGTGTIHNDSTNFSVKMNTDLDYFFQIESDFRLLISDAEIDFNFSRDNRSLDFSNLLGAMSVTCDRLNPGVELKDIYLGVIFNSQKLYYDISSDISDYARAESDGFLDMSRTTEKLVMDRFWVDYNNVEWENEDPFVMSLSDSLIKVDSFTLAHANSNVHGDIQIDRNFNQSMNLQFVNVLGNDFIQLLSGEKSDNFKASINSDLKIRGSLENPQINFYFTADNVGFDNIIFGNLLGSLRYTNSTLYPDILFLDTQKNMEKPIFSVIGEIPYIISFSNTNRKIAESQDIDLNILAKNFNLKTFGNYLPGIYNQTGNLDLKVNFSGTFDNPNFSGFLKLDNGIFNLRSNGIQYNLKAESTMLAQTISVDSFILSSQLPNKPKRVLNTKGNILLNKFALKDIDLKINGDLDVLSNESKVVNPNLYGDVYLRTDGEWKFGYTGGKGKLAGNVVVENTDLVFAGGQSSFSSNDEIVYQYIIDSTRFSQNKALYDDILNSLDSDVRMLNNNDLAIDVDLGFNFGSDVNLTFLLSQVWNQRLVARTSGDLKLKVENGNSTAQGTLNLLEGSKFEYFKTFDATGQIRFEGSVENPNIDIVSKYSSDWLDKQDIIQPVEVRIQLEGQLNNLGQKLASDPNNFSVYVGRRNIDDNVPSNRYDDSDAISFILIGKFKDELTSSDKRNLAQDAAIGNTATALLGSVLTSFVNSALGDVVNNIQLNQAGVDTRFKVSGKVQNVRYSIGGTQEVFQDINKADIKIEWLLTPRFLLRVERKDPVVRSSGLYEKISEFGAKYRFQF